MREHTEIVTWFQMPHKVATEIKMVFQMPFKRVGL
jgi:hypothetical protein